MKPEDIKVGSWYRLDEGMIEPIDAQVTAIIDGEVNYSMKGIRSFLPLWCSLEKFAEWAQEEIV